MEEVGRKLYLSETRSIGWEGETLGAKRRISSSENATVPGTVDLVELLFSAVLMLVDWLVGSVSRSREARLWELPEFFRRSVSVEKVCWAYFLNRKRSASIAARGRRTEGARAARNETGRGLKWQGPPGFMRRGRPPFKPQTGLLRSKASAGRQYISRWA